MPSVGHNLPAGPRLESVSSMRELPESLKETSNEPRERVRRENGLALAVILSNRRLCAKTEGKRNSRQVLAGLFLIGSMAFAAC